MAGACSEAGCHSQCGWIVSPESQGGAPGVPQEPRGCPWSGLEISPAGVPGKVVVMVQITASLLVKPLSCLLNCLLCALG